MQDANRATLVEQLTLLQQHIAQQRQQMFASGQAGENTGGFGNPQPYPRGGSGGEYSLAQRHKDLRWNGRRDTARFQSQQMFSKHAGAQRHRPLQIEEDYLQNPQQQI